MDKYTYVTPTERVRIYYWFGIIAIYEVKGFFGWRTKIRRYYESSTVNPVEEIKKAYKTKYKSSTKIVRIPTYPGNTLPISE